MHLQNSFITDPSNDAPSSIFSRFSQKQIELIKSTIAKGATDDELALFLYIAQKYDLDPLVREIWFIKPKPKPDRNDNPPSIFTGRDGFLKIAHRSGVFDGMESYTIDDQHGNPIKAICKVYRKDMSRPFVAEAKFNEYYNPNNPSWRYKSAMIIKVAEVAALRRAFNISGLVAQEEIDTTSTPQDTYQTKNHDHNQDTLNKLLNEFQTIAERFHTNRRAKALEYLKSSPLSQSQLETLIEKAKSAFIDHSQASFLHLNADPHQLNQILKQYGLQKVEDITKDIFNEICDKLFDNAQTQNPLPDNDNNNNNTQNIMLNPEP